MLMMTFLSDGVEAMFSDYRSTVDDLRKEVKSIKRGREIMQSRGVNIDSFESIYEAEQKQAKK